LKKKEDGGIAIYSSTEGLIMETETVLDTVIRNSGTGTHYLIDDRELMSFKEIGRRRRLLRGRDTYSATKGTRGKDRNLPIQQGIKGHGIPRRIDTAYIGIGMGMQGLVFAKKDSGQGIDIDDQRRFNLRGIALKVEPANTIVGMGTIPHCGMTVRDNLLAIKALVNGKLLGKIFNLIY
jgi:hypothetical protein